jgi:hypothetical protein
VQARELYDDNLRLRKARHLLDTDLVECKAALHDARARLRNATAEAHRLQQLAHTATAAATAATKAIAPPGTVQVHTCATSFLFSFTLSFDVVVAMRYCCSFMILYCCIAFIALCFQGIVAFVSCCIWPRMLHILSCTAVTAILSSISSCARCTYTLKRKTGVRQ